MSRSRITRRRHYAQADFTVTVRSSLGSYGYCRKCGGDMQQFNSDGLLRHYNSHGRSGWKLVDGMKVSLSRGAYKGTVTAFTA